ILPGWRFSYDNNKLIISVFGGPVAQDYRLTPNDPTSRLRGFYIGGELSADIWFQPTAQTMAAINATLATIGPTGSLRTAFGVRVFDKAFIGPELEELWCGNFEELQFGAHLTGLRTQALEWSAAGGWSLTSDQRQGPYMRLGVNVKY
ncbi:MAG TPA: cellulose biosynthesis protein BcsS, partial [Pirellulales bacterium]